MGLGTRLFRKESLERYLQQDQRLAKTLTAKDLIALGVGAVIGTGIFILPGTIAALHSGPAITLSFMIAAVVCAVAAMCYAEFSSALPVAGSAYSYGNIIFGELIGWLLGWALFLEYMLSVAAVSTGWSAYFVSFIEGFGVHIPKAITGSFDPAHGTYINLFAVLIVTLISVLLMSGTRSSTRINNLMVTIKIGVVLLFLVVGIFYVKSSNWQPFMPFGVSGVFKGASLVFFAYLGFDCVSASAAEVKNPQKNLPIGIIGTLVICTLLYILVAFVLTGMVSYRELNVANPVAFALQVVHQNWFAGLLSLGALAGMFTMMLTMTYSSSRLVYSIGRDGLLPKMLGKIETRHQTPINSVRVVTVIIATLGGLVSLDQLTNLVNIGTLIAFFFMSIGVIPLRKRKDIPNKDGFKVPLYPWLPLLSGLLCLFMLFELPAVTWMAAEIWFILGLIIYFSYGLKHSRLND
ncbi:amino acid permease [Latilactobacillus sakei]|uniref:Amino acid permease n=1 Tax=Latilactobacillus sakei TaxID=1599 RepID=A0AAX0VA90_LATSK|nr:amino acid permease [Latilactobacillus sakei]ASN11889.1 amino acid permease [Latilactobacillus sakei]MDN4010643.1 amino acid permease [Latilactobacillus sakei]PKX72206.1 amino acid permease [Latilactobacillus sakei]PKX77345.1 amino acid permease [Latilactobacillus sakei]UNC21324.1 amino acid permease [Latilactobacillus sakei]